MIVDWTSAERPPKPASKPFSVEIDQVRVPADTAFGAPIGNGGTSPVRGIVIPTAPHLAWPVAVQSVTVSLAKVKVRLHKVPLTLAPCCVTVVSVVPLARPW